jgi:hypothetical protein
MTINNICFYLQNRLIQTSQTGGQWYSDTSPFSIPWLDRQAKLHFTSRMIMSPDFPPKREKKLIFLSMIQLGGDSFV